MPTRREQLEQQLKDAKEAENKVLGKLDDCMKQSEAVRARLWNEVVPHIKSRLESKIKGGVWDQSELAKIVLEKTLEVVLGNDWQSHLEKL